ncbi:MAG: flagellar transcriptional regulator FlhD [Lamprobacter sp.]|uniref:flagellar transcriptional regulator FlhD n=1 Tax=Lamprobacter sp. TaxID=3100796 RepID=UPI002B260A3A|nr:flagellar transcriptional regulator FlhD [Lamprobacter sp.]MEA3639772.1 flagellar transcriptional regulator FlhD [Lamprobacter sp.]
MDEDCLINEIQDLNLTYLLLAHRMLQSDRASAMFRLKISDEMAELLLSLSARQLAKLSRTNQLLCRFGYDDVEQLRTVTHQPREQDLSGFHSSLLMASRPHRRTEETGN